jgi:hypothetical protein
MKYLLYSMLIVFAFIGCQKYDCAQDECADGLLKATIPSTIDRIVIKDGNGTFNIRKQAESAFFFPGGWIEEKGYNNFSVSGNTLTIKNTFSDSYISLQALNDIEIVDGNSSTYISKSFSTGEMSMSIGGNASVYFDEVCGDEAQDQPAPRSSDFDLVVDVSQNGTLHGYGVKFRDVSADVYSNGTVKVNVEQNLTVNIPSNGDVYYKGMPSITSNIGFMGSLINDN